MVEHKRHLEDIYFFYGITTCSSGSLLSLLFLIFEVLFELFLLFELLLFVIFLRDKIRGLPVLFCIFGLWSGLLLEVFHDAFASFRDQICGKSFGLRWFWCTSTGSYPVYFKIFLFRDVWVD